MPDHSSASPDTTKPKISSITSLRFFAALCIFILHAKNHDLVDESVLSTFDLSKAVSFFFVLSGFVLGYAYSEKQIRLSVFYKQRIARIFPITIFSIIFVILLLPSSLYLPSEDTVIWSKGFVLLINLLCLQAFIPVPDIFFGFNAVAWSISAELFFYLCFPFLKKLNKTGIILIFLILLSSISFALLLIPLLNIPFYSPLSLDKIVLEGIYYINPVVRLPEFIIGIFAARLFLIANARRMFLLRYNHQFIQAFLFDFSILGLAYIGLRSHFVFLSSPINSFLSQIISAFIFAILLILVAGSEGFINRFLSFRPFIFLGNISFGLYLFHQPLMIRSVQMGGIYFGSLQLLPSQFCMLLVTSILISALAFLIIERPFSLVAKHF